MAHGMGGICISTGFLIARPDRQFSSDDFSVDYVAPVIPTPMLPWYYKVTASGSS